MSFWWKYLLRHFCCTNLSSISVKGSLYDWTEKICDFFNPNILYKNGKFLWTGDDWSSTHFLVYLFWIIQRTCQPQVVHSILTRILIRSLFSFGAFDCFSEKNIHNKHTLSLYIWYVKLNVCLFTKKIFLLFIHQKCQVRIELCR